MRFKQMSLALAVSLATTYGVQAAELGSMVVYSAINEPLNARVTVESVDPAVQPLIIRLAPTSLYVKAGKSLAPEAIGLTMSVLSKKPTVVEIRGKTPVQASSFPLIIEMTEGKKRSAKLYDVTVRQPQPLTELSQIPSAGATQQEETKVPAANSAEEKVPGTQSPRSVEEVKSTEKQTQDAVAAVTEVVKPAPDNTAAPAAVKKVPDEVKTTAQAAVKKVPDEFKTEQKVPQDPIAVLSNKPAPISVKGMKPVKLPLKLADYNLQKPFLVKPGMTTWSIAKLYQSQFKTHRMEQIIVALVRKNPECFTGGRVGSIVFGSYLVAPTKAEVDDVGLDEGWVYLRLNPQGDARAEPAEADLLKARQELVKQNPFNARKFKNHDKPVKAEPKEDARPQPVSQKVSQPEPQADIEQKPAQSVDKPEKNEPVAKLDKGVTPIENPSPKAVQEPAAAPAVLEQTPSVAPKEKSPGLLWGILGGGIALVGALVGLLIARRRRKTVSQDNDQPVTFMNSTPMTDEQKQGVKSMTENRLAADAAAQRGFPVEPTLGAQLTANAGNEPSNLPQQPVKADSKVEPTFGPLPQDPMSVPGDPAEELSEAAEAKMQSKLATARNYIAVGATGQARRLLMEVQSLGTQAQREEAQKLTAEIDA